MSSPVLTLYFDGNCPFCAAEMRRLKSWNTAGRLGFVDIAAADFDPAPLGVGYADLDRELHARTADDRLLVGIDSMLEAYTLVGKSWLVWPLRVGALRPLLTHLYRGFARNRYRFSRWLGYRRVEECASGVCRIDSRSRNS